MLQLDTIGVTQVSAFGTLMTVQRKAVLLD